MSFFGQLSRGKKISDYFPTYNGDGSLESVQNFILKLFITLKRNEAMQLFYHFTTAVDTENIRVVFNAVKKTIFQKNLENIMLQ